jgi:hypothetical protein
MPALITEAPRLPGVQLAGHHRGQAWIGFRRIEVFE